MKIAVADSETDPFDGKTEVKPFVWGFYDGDCFRYFWGKDWKDTTRQFIEFLASYEEPLIIYMHNGGKFDVFFLFEYLGETLRIVNNRILQCYIGIHEIRDSYAVVPAPLGAYQKDVFDYTKMDKRKREAHKAEILSYLQNDCLYLYQLMAAFIEEFGPRLTIGGTAMHELKKFHSFKTGRQLFDERFRPFYFGGRNQCFASGVIEGSWKIYDVNSMYPYVMREFRHPVSTKNRMSKRITKKTNFACIQARNYGALPTRTPEGLDFTIEWGEFFASIHEIEAGEDTGTLKIEKVKYTLDCDQTSSFQEFVDFYNAKKITAEKNGDKLHRLFYKLLLNSAYGKFAQNPENYRDYMLTKNEWPGEGWNLSESNGEFKIWARPSPVKSYYNVATAASITGAARAQLLRGLARAENPVYCDTDSIICHNLTGEIDPTRLGSWKVEAEGNQIAIAGKKLYAVFQDAEPVKQASKGATLTANQIRKIAQGESVCSVNLAPSFHLDGTVDFIHRTIRSTVKAKAWKGRQQ